MGRAREPLLLGTCVVVNTWHVLENIRKYIIPQSTTPTNLHSSTYELYFFTVHGKFPDE